MTEAGDRGVLSTFRRDHGPKAAAHAAGKIAWYWVVDLVFDPAALGLTPRDSG